MVVFQSCTETLQNIFSLTYAFESQRKNLTLRQNSLFNLTENFTYDDLDRLIEWIDSSSL